MTDCEMEKNEGKLVCISDFCKTVKNRRRRELTNTNTSLTRDVLIDESSHFLDDTNDSLNITLSDLIPNEQAMSNGVIMEKISATVVDVSILDMFPLENVPATTNLPTDEYATIYTKDCQLLLEIQCFNGDICMLTMAQAEEELENRRQPQWIPAIIRVLSGTMSDDCIGINAALNDDAQLLPSPNFRIYVPPTLAAVVGLHDYGCMNMPLKAYISSVSEGTSAHLLPKKLTGRNASSTMLPYATKAKIVELYSPPGDYLPSMETMEMQGYEMAMRRFREERKSKQIEMLQRYFLRMENNGNVCAPRLATIGTIFAVINDCIIDDKDAEHPCGRFHNGRSFVRFYMILGLETESGVLVQCTDTAQNQNECFCWISPKAELVLVPSEKDKLFSTSRMPRLSAVWSFHRSMQNDKKQWVRKSLASSWSHPHLVAILEAMMAIETMITNAKAKILPLSYHMLHLIGNENNHITFCLDAVADSVGRNIIHICGLASFAYNLKSSEFEGVGQRNVIGSISDKILGLQLALKMAQRSSPCILHICLDEEISDTDDIESRHDEENRLLSSLREGISHSYSESISGELPPILIVISTKDDMEGGPLASMILYDSISVDAPNDIYAKALWNDNDTFPDAKNDLAGRSANEIQFLGNFVRKKKFDQLQNNIDLGLFSVANALSNAMHCKDDVDLFQSFNQMSSALIPNVKWDDIGGLSHVRDEIIDAIELPLLHPHLFVGSRRSGILFFGPPGSGKTLVAKAVASECGLPFISVKGPELLGSYVGESEANIRKVFASAREAAASSIHKDDRGGAAILFFDEIDSLAPRRGELGDGGGVMERVVSTLLGEMDRDINTDSLDCKPCHVFVIGATNRPDLLDPSLLRPGRFDRIVYLGLAKEREDRIQILAAQTRKFTFRDGIDSEKMAAEVIDRIPQSLSGADFSGVASRALMLAFKRVCDMADNEAVSKNNSVESILNDWPEDKLTPRVDAEDFIAAANEIHPSVNDEELKKYEAMRNEYCHER